MLVPSGIAGCVAAPAAAPTPAYSPAPRVSIPVPPPAGYSPALRPTAPPPRAMQARLESLIAAFPGKAGAAIRSVDEGWAVSRGGSLSLPQQSVSKLWVAMTILDLRDKGRLTIDEPITIGRDDLTLFHQPVAALVMKNGGYRTTIGDLLTRALTQSDNTANDRLLRRAGGPAAVRAFIADHGLGAIRFGPGERLLQSGTAGLSWSQSMATGRGFEAARARLSDATRAAALQRYIDNPPDGAAPLAITAALSKLARGELLSETSTRYLLQTMSATVTGRARLRAATPPGWRIAHKTGTGQDYRGRNAGFNDIGLLTAPDGRRYAIAVMIGDTRAPMRQRQLLIQAVCSLVTGGRTGAGGAEYEGDG